MAALQDEEVQMKGVVYVNYALGAEHIISNRAEKAAEAWWHIPTRLVAVHLCYNTNAMEVYVKNLSRAMESQHLCRFRSHFGTWKMTSTILKTWFVFLM